MSRKRAEPISSRSMQATAGTPTIAKPTRREFVLGAIGGVTAAALVGGCNGQSSAAEGGTGGIGGEDGGAGDGGAGDGGACTVYPQQTEGPYYLDLNQLRRDITEGKPGTPLRLIIQVVSATGCTPLRDLAVDIWHADASGVYSGYGGQPGGVDTTGQTFLRGTQITGDDGRVQFDTIYPGWYNGRTTHIHFKVHLTGTTEATSQMYFPENITAAVYETAPYSARGQKDTSNAADSIARNNTPPLLALTGDSTGYQAMLTVTVAG